MSFLILVDEQDNPVGEMEKMETHQKGLLHRAFSVFIFNSNGDMLLQQRSLSKYHSPGLWTNACCSHPYAGEEVLTAAERRLNEEMGFTTKLTKAFDFIYKASFDNGLTEYEFDHVFFGNYEGTIAVNKDEVMNFEYLSIQEIDFIMDNTPEKFTAWFKIAYPRLKETMKLK